ncbi:MAG: type II toxin-antitoxin system ParD family antitoxin [Bacteroidales bacterium]|nr:type II toxin-antitoxin system ParD family antitoxin [Bacteroidales bacterium]MCD8386870.1 type II toxin-antitoxin system ParD family antitoxin [Bacteroidales bacterium]
MKTTSVALGEYFDNYIKSQVKSGRYNNASEMVRCALRLLEAHDAQIQALRNAIDQGINSGIAPNFDPEKFWASLETKWLNEEKA